MKVTVAILKHLKSTEIVVRDEAGKIIERTPATSWHACKIRNQVCGRWSDADGVDEVRG